MFGGKKGIKVRLTEDELLAIARRRKAIEDQKKKEALEKARKIREAKEKKERDKKLVQNELYRKIEEKKKIERDVDMLRRKLANMPN
ncbi:hypothetical protein DVH24_042617 [Malus domestica]|uniref:Uncharacterized protein n=1 Tax=Malus domestica TaxID=3750 RepID=A0A498HYD3_MALDO|nr:hypothetical protein DVH24_042617 [Malus domestica]